MSRRVQVMCADPLVREGGQDEGIETYGNARDSGSPSWV